MEKTCLISGKAKISTINLVALQLFKVTKLTLDSSGSEKTEVKILAPVKELQKKSRGS